MHGLTGLKVDQRWIAASDLEAMADVVYGIFLVERSQVVIDGNPLRELNEIRVPECFPKFRLADQNVF